MSNFGDTVLSVGKVNHKVNHNIITITINFKRNAPKNKTLDTATINNMVDTLKGNNLIPSTFNATIFRIEQKPFTTYLTINLKESS